MKRSRSLSSRPLGLVRLVLLSAGLASCAVLTPRTGVDLPPADAVVDRLRTRQEKVRTFAGRGSVKLIRDRSEQYMDVMVAAARPDRLRIQGFDFMGRPVMMLTINDERLSWLDYRQSVLFEGPATPKNIGLVLPLGLSVSEVVSMLSGGLPLAQYEKARLEEKRSIGGDAWVLSLFRPGGGFVEKVWMAPSGQRVSRVELGPNGREALYRLDYADYRPVEGQDDNGAPFQIKVADTATGREVVFNYTEVKINPALPAGLFQLKAPPGVIVAPIPD